MEEDYQIIMLILKKKYKGYYWGDIKIRHLEIIHARKILYSNNELNSFNF